MLVEDFVGVILAGGKGTRMQTFLQNTLNLFYLF